MRYLLQALIVVLIFSTVASEAQINVSIRKKDFKTDKPGFDEAWRHIANADLYYSKGGVWYSGAFDEYF
jgi:hypothetical protein